MEFLFFEIEILRCFVCLACNVADLGVLLACQPVLNGCQNTKWANYLRLPGGMQLERVLYVSNLYPSGYRS